MPCVPGIALRALRSLHCVPGIAFPVLRRSLTRLQSPSCVATRILAHPHSQSGTGAHFVQVDVALLVYIGNRRITTII